MRFGILRTSTVAGANVAGLILGTALFSMFLMLTLYMQQVLGYSAMKSGVAYLAVAGTAILWSAVAAQLVNRIGVKPVLLVGMVSLTAGLLYFTQVSVDGSYLGDLLPGFLLTGLGIGFSFVPISIAALAGVQPAEAGLASGLFNTSQQIGGALGIAALSTIATSRTESAVESGNAVPVALVDGFSAAFTGGVVVAALGIIAALVLIRSDEMEPVVEPELELELEAGLARHRRRTSACAYAEGGTRTLAFLRIPALSVREGTEPVDPVAVRVVDDGIAHSPEGVPRCLVPVVAVTDERFVHRVAGLARVSEQRTEADQVHTELSPDRA